MSLDASAIQYARTMLIRGYGYQNACRIAGVNEADLRSLMTGPARPSPSPWNAPEYRLNRNPVHVRAQPAVSVPVQCRMIIQSVATHYGMTVEDLIGPTQSRPFAYARHEAMFRVRQERKLSLPAIGRIFGGRDHSTVLSGVRAHEARTAWGAVLTALADFRQPDLFSMAA